MPQMVWEVNLNEEGLKMLYKLFLIIMFVMVGFLVNGCQKAEKIECVITEPQETVETATEETAAEESKPTQ